MRSAIVSATLALGLLSYSALAQTQLQPQNQQPEPALNDDTAKPQQNSADEAAVRGRLEDGIKPNDTQNAAASKTLEDAAAAAKAKSDGATGKTDPPR